MTPDYINGLFEVVGSMFTFLSVMKLHKDKCIRGVHPAPIVFFTSWGLWNMYYYPYLEQWASFFGGLLLVAVNVIWLSQMFYYRKN